MGAVVDVCIPIAPFAIRGRVSLPDGARGVVIVAQGSGSSRPGHRERLLAERLEAAGLGTAWLDLFTHDEGERDEGARLVPADVNLLAGRLVVATDWLGEHAPTRGLRLAYVAVGANAGAALVAAAERSSAVAGVVAWNGRTELPSLGVTTPTLRLGDAVGRGAPADQQAELARDWLARACAGTAG